MIEELNSYLLQHKSIGIPGLGTIYVERIPAQSDFVNKQLLPPAYHYRFNKYFDVPDKQFFSYLAAQKEVADYEAIRIYNEWAQEFKSKIETDREVRWNGVGVLTADDSGDILFEPVASLTSFMPAVPAQRVIRDNVKRLMLVGDKELTNEEMAGFLSEETQVEKPSWWMYALIILALALIFIFFYYYNNDGMGGIFGNRRPLPNR
ncbi:MAG: hypothetical protein JNL51_11095 [Chitinophagaceae bacterium]|nr:hypothetical protein [Chitinophagaceae bacterium]